MFYRCNIYSSPFRHRGTSLFRGGNVFTGDYTCYLCQRSDLRDWRIGEPFALLSQCSLTHHLHGIFQEETRVGYAEQGHF